MNVQVRVRLVDDSSGSDPAADASKDQLVLAMLAVLGGEEREINERDLFLACWHGFPNAMRWVDTSLPNPDTFTASLRRLDARGFIKRSGKTHRDTRRKRKAPQRRASALDVARSGVVRASIVSGALERAGVSSDLLDAVGTLRVPEQDYVDRDPVLLLLTCIGLREDADRHLDEGALVETAFHKFPAVFAYAPHPEWPDVEQVRAALRGARQRGLVDSSLSLTSGGRATVGQSAQMVNTRLDPSASFRAGTLRFADRVEKSDGYVGWVEDRSLARTKRDELFRMLRVPPTTDPKPVADALSSRRRELLRVDKGALAEYLLRLADKWNPAAAALASGATTDGQELTEDAPDD